MEVIFEFLFQLLLEFILQIFGELLVELGLRSLAEPFREREERHPLLTFVGYALLGLTVGGLSLLVFPNSFVRSASLHGISLLIMPTLAGLLMSGMGWLRNRQGQRLVKLDTFSYGFIFALGMASVRFLFTT
jgi:hypothetical protein